MESTKKANKKNWAVRIAIIAFALTLITCCLLGSTMAKYTTTYAGDGSTANIADWAWEINGADAAADFTFTAGDILDTYDGNADDDVATDMIAPGTKGSYSLEITNNSDVNGEYAIAFTTIVSSPIKFYSDAECTTDLADIDATAIDMGETATVTVYWQWAFESDDDEADTALAGQTNVELLSAAATFSQVD